MDDRYDDNPMLIKHRQRNCRLMTSDEARALQCENPLSFVSRIPFYAKIKDLNNSPDSPYENPPHTAVEIGLKLTF